MKFKLREKVRNFCFVLFDFLLKYLHQLYQTLAELGLQLGLPFWFSSTHME